MEITFNAIPLTTCFCILLIPTMQKELRFHADVAFVASIESHIQKVNKINKFNLAEAISSRAVLRFSAKLFYKWKSISSAAIAFFSAVLDEFHVDAGTDVPKDVGTIRGEPFRSLGPPELKARTPNTNNKLCTRCKTNVAMMLAARFIIGLD